MKLTDHQTATLRALLREVCIARDKGCVKCGFYNYKLTDTSHVLGKGAYPALQYEIDNVILLCGNGSPNNCHHNWWHFDQSAGMEWFESTYPERVEYLNSIRNRVKKPDYEEIKAQLTELLTFYINT